MQARGRKIVRSFGTVPANVDAPESRRRKRWAQFAKGDHHLEEAKNVAMSVKAAVLLSRYRGRAEMRERIPREGDSIRDFFRTDHERPDHAFEGFCRARRNDLVLARLAFDEFVSALERHFRWEEEGLFAAFEATDASAPKIVMRAKHRVYPMADRMLDAAGRKTLLRRLTKWCAPQADADS
jgi:hypothetical protein